MEYKKFDYSFLDLTWLNHNMVLNLQIDIVSFLGQCYTFQVIIDFDNFSIFFVLSNQEN